MLTGATGFIGTHLVERLVSEGHQLSAVVRNPSSIPELRLRGVTAFRGDLSDTDSLRRAMVGSEIVFNLARAKAHGTRPREAFAVNVGGTRNAARAAMDAGVSRFVHCSSATVYGSRAGTVSEASRIRPDSAYARSKAQGEAAVLEECGDKAVIARISAVMGPGCTSWRALFRSAASGKLRIVGDGSNLQHPVDVADVVSALIRCAAASAAAGRVYNVAGPAPLPMAGLRRLMAGSDIRQPRSYPSAMIDLFHRASAMSDTLTGLRLPLSESAAFLSADRVLDLSRSRAELGYDPSFDVQSAVNRTADWLRKQGLL